MKRNVAVLGAGFIGKVHLEALRAVDCNLIYIYDHHIENAKALAALCGAKATTSLDEVLASEVDVVHICLPANLHGQVLRRCLEAGKDVFCEKPLVLDPKEALDFVRAYEAKGLLCGLGFNLRFYPAIQTLREKIRRGDIGRVHLVHGAYLQEFHALPAPWGWRYQEDKAGKMRAVTEIGSHWFDLLQYLMSEKVTALSSTLSYLEKERKLVDGTMYPESHPEGQPIRVESEDGAVVTMRLSGGTLANCVLSEVAQGKGNEISFHIEGEKGGLYWNSQDLSSYYVGLKDRGMTRFTAPFSEGYPGTYRLLFSDFYRALHAKKDGVKVPDVPSHAATMREGADSVMISQAVYESAHRGGVWISLEETEGRQS